MKRVSFSVRPDSVMLTLGRHTDHITHHEAKALAWGMLADLEPDEPEVAAKRARPVTSLKGGRKSNEPLVAQRILAVLGSGRTMTAADIAQAISETSGTVSARCFTLRERGLVRRVDYGSAGQPATYVITDKGREALG